ncbi:FixH family protein [Sporosarcina sp. G11-34]|uniref:FixH family protein n=1 Tax=Sporosarcina sp. G11-34 TaxID=2849605 RepID=UPI0022A92010|nr:FixH family protein [Sporosarcina sp. G11-34]MCZ2257857.1 FixH family protein [Sporosarcina sp. G11-34]
MKRKFLMFLFILVLGVMAACSKDEEKVEEEDVVILPIAVELTVPEAADVSETIKMESLVTQGEEKVEDASLVEFEIWEEGKKTESIMVDSINEKEGIYSAETTFDHDGLFHIQVHVTARNMHTMPTKTVTVGNGGDYEEVEGHDHKTEGFSMDFVELDVVKVNDEAELIVHLQLDGNPLENVKVRYEIWTESDSDNRDWVNAEESPSGEYKAVHVFAKDETFHIVIHVEDDAELHEHEEHLIEVVK